MATVTRLDAPVHGQSGRVQGWRHHVLIASDFGSGARDMSPPVTYASRETLAVLLASIVDACDLGAPIAPTGFLGLRKKIGGSQTTTGGGDVQRVTPTATAHSSSKRRRRIGVHGNGAQKATRMLSVLLTVLLQCYSAMLNC